ncbi:MAG: hypothetical protein V5A43_11945, partial [Haloarculaceae archaeon]
AKEQEEAEDQDEAKEQEDQQEQGDQQEQETHQEEGSAAGEEGWLTRRRALLGTGLVGLLGVGYTVLSIMDPPNAPAPTFPTEQMEAQGWERITGEGALVTEVRLGPLSIPTETTTVQYGNRELLEEVRAREVTIEGAGETFSRPIAVTSSEALDQYLALVVGSRIDPGPDVDNMPLGIGRAEVMGAARSTAQLSFEETMTNVGLQNVERTEAGTLEVATGETATLYRYHADFPFDGGAAAVLGEELEIPSTAVKMAGHLAVWHHDDWIMVAAGVHPDENYSESVQRDLETGETATLSLDLGLTPSAYREDILGYIEQMR